jgi:hypothetical protein
LFNSLGVAAQQLKAILCPNQLYDNEDTVRRAETVDNPHDQIFEAVVDCTGFFTANFLEEFLERHFEGMINLL